MEPIIENLRLQRLLNKNFSKSRISANFEKVSF